MKNQFEDKFLDYLEGKLSETGRQALESALQSDAALKKSFDSYKKVLGAEQIIHSQKHEMNANFAVKVMDEIEKKNKGYFRRLFMEMSSNSRVLTRTFASIAILVCVVQIYRTTTTPIEFSVNAGIPEQADSIMAEKPITREIGPTIAKEEPKDFADKLKQDLNKSNEVAKYSGAEAVPPVSKAKPAEAAQPSIARDARERDNEAQLRRNSNVDTVMSKVLEVDKKIEQMQGATAPLAVQERLGQWPAAAPANNAPYLAGGMAADSDAYAPPAYSNSAEKYAGYEENPRIEVKKEASSTFSIDVDTASYTNTRRFLKAGNLPPKDSVRIEEFLNYFDYSYPQQYEKDFTTSYEIAPSPLEADRYLLKLGVKARDKKESSKPWNLVFLVDISGSMMDQNKLPLVQKSLRLLTENMKEGDRVAIVTYAGAAGTLLDSTTIKDKAKILSAIDALNAGGSTNGSGGIIAAYDVAMKNKIDGVNRVVLATDGDFNVGVTSRDELVRLIEEKRKSGVTLTTLGFGQGNINDSNMEQLANKGNGNYFYIDSFQEARKVLETDLAGTMEVVAKDVKLQIEFNPEHVQSYRLIGYENRKLKREDFTNDAIDAGEIGTGHTVTAIYEVVLTNSPLAKKLNEEYRYQDNKVEEKKDVPSKALSAELAFLKIRYKQPEGSESTELKFPIELQQVKSDAAQSSADFKFAAAVSYFGHKLRSSQYAGSYSYGDIIALAEKGKAEDKRGYRQEFIELLRDAASIR